MSVYKEMAFILEDIEEKQDKLNVMLSRFFLPAFHGQFNVIRGFDLSNSRHEASINYLREFCRSWKNEAEITHSSGLLGPIWTFTAVLDEGTFGWKVIIQKYDGKLGLLVKPFSRYEA